MDADDAELFDGISDLQRILVGLMPAEIRGFYAKIHERIVKELGESPEAWRGAAEMSLEVMRCVMVGDSKLANSTPSERLIMLICSGIATSPYVRAALEGK